MGVFNAPMGMGIVANPLTDSPYSDQANFGYDSPYPGGEFMITEDNIYMIDEPSSDRMITE